jgi:hypothetical protein
MIGDRLTSPALNFRHDLVGGIARRSSAIAFRANIIDYDFRSFRRQSESMGAPNATAASSNYRKLFPLAVHPLISYFLIFNRLRVDSPQVAAQRAIPSLLRVRHSRMLLSGIQARPELDPRLKHSGVTPLG